MRFVIGYRAADESDVRWSIFGCSNRGGLDFLELPSARLLICNRLVGFAVPNRRWPLVYWKKKEQNGKGEETGERGTGGSRIARRPDRSP